MVTALSFVSPEPGSARWVQRGRVYTSTGWAVLTRAQEILARVNWPALAVRLGSLRAYRTGGPLDAPGTRIATSAENLRADADHGPATNGLLWLAVATAARPGAALADITSGAAFRGDNATLNVLDKIEQSLQQGRIHPTALEAVLWLIAREREGVTWEQHIRDRDPRLTVPGVERADVPTWPLRQRLPVPPSLLGRVIVPEGTPTERRVFVATAETCLPLLAGDLTTLSIRDAMQRALQPLGTLQGIEPRVVRDLAGLGESCNERVTVSWPVSIPDVPRVDGADGRVAVEVARALLRELPRPTDRAEWSAGATPFDPRVHGALGWWVDGGAAASRSRDTPAPLHASDNPHGPNELRPQTIAPIDVLREGVSTVRTMVFLTSAAGLAWLLFPVVKDVLSSRK